jgi:hypothetical protein
MMNDQIDTPEFSEFHPGDNIPLDLKGSRLEDFLRLGYHVWIVKRVALKPYFSIGIRYEPKCLTFLSGEGKNIKDILESLWQKMENGNINIDTAVKWLTESHDSIETAIMNLVEDIIING